ncbi:hypothetical protein [Methylibium sp.]|uniref:hypothetical protein n=1 Tax=Methylibium sp. TaxID=2067992 RepID=UPI003D0BC546
MSGALFDDVLVPLAEARRTSGAPPYFPPWKDATVSSYFVRSEVTRLTSTDFEFPGDGYAEGLVDSLEAWWREHGDRELAVAAPRLKAVANALRSEAVQDDGSVDIFCYTLF